jgi:hypothetical protein
MKLLSVVAFMIFAVLGIGSPRGETCADNLNVKDKVCNLDTSRLPTPDKRSPNYHAPRCDKARPLTDGVIDSLVNACNLAPISVQQDIFSLTNIFIVQNPNGLPDDWGFWESKDKKDADDGMNNRSYIGLLEAGITAQEKLSIEEQNLTRKLLRPIGLDIPNAVTVTAVPDTKELAILARMAHETAHVKYYKQNIIKEPCFSNPTNGQSKFMDASWDQTSLPTGPNGGWRKQYFTNFGDDAKTKHLRNTNIPHLNKNDIRSPTDLYKIIKDGSFVSLFASVRPDEDFVETYKFFALKNNVPGGLTDYSIQFGGGSPQVIIVGNDWKSSGTGGRGASVREKAECIKGLAPLVK